MLQILTNSIKVGFYIVCISRLINQLFTAIYFKMRKSDTTVASVKMMLILLIFLDITVRGGARNFPKGDDSSDRD